MSVTFKFLTITSLFLLGGSGIFAQFNLIDTSPNKNAVSVPVTQSVVLQFSDVPSASSASSNILLQSNLRGKIPSTVEIVDNSLIIKPSKIFEYAEEITVSVASALQSSVGATLSSPFSIQFLTEAKPSLISPPEFIGNTIFNDYQARVTKIEKADLDQDSDIDIIFIGSTVGWLENTGAGNFVRHDIASPNDFLFDFKIFDIDQDDDLDIIVSASYNGIIIYYNDGNQNFTQNIVGGTGSASGIDIQDFDSNGTYDIVYTSTEQVFYPGGMAYYYVSGTYILYHSSDGSFNKTPISSTFGFNAKCADLDNDGDWDVVLNDDQNLIFLLNTGSAFKPDTVISKETSIQSIYIGDLDSDQDVDIILSKDGSLKVLVNNGSLQFTSKVIDSEYGIGSLALADFDGDRDLDMIFLNGNYKYSLMQNNGNANFSKSEITQSSLDAVFTPANSIAADFNGDGVLDFASVTSYYIIKLFISTKFPFSDETPPGFKSITQGDADWGDYDNDGDLDLIMTGTLNDVPTTALYENQNGKFVEKQTSMPGLFLGSCDWGDFDKDGDLDILLMGASHVDFYSSTLSSLIYVNNGGEFSLLASSATQLPKTYYGKARWADMNNDGWLDIVFNSMSASGIYQSDGKGNFSLRYELPSVFQYGNLDMADYDHDGDVDIAVSGWRGNEELGALLKVYRNDGNWSFSEAQGDFVGRIGGNLNWADMDNDGDLDLVVSGMIWSSQGSYASMTVYENTGDSFKSLTNSELLYQADFYGTTSAGDSDNDGIVDVVASTQGGNSFNPAMTLLKNNGEGDLTDAKIYLPPITTRVAAWADYDQDHDLDIFVQTNLLRNNVNKKNSPPSAPSQIKIDSVSNNSLYFHWNGGDDLETGTTGLSYQIYAGTQSHLQNIVNSNSDLSTGKRKIVDLGNAKGKSAHIDHLLGGTYFIGVQSIDAAFEGSPFSEEVNVPVIAIKGDSAVCSGQTYTYKTNPEGNYLWEANGGSIVSGQGTDTVVIKWGPAGNGFVKISDSQNQLNKIFINIDQKPLPIISGNTKVCSGVETYTLADGLSYYSKWNILGGDTTTNEQTHSVSVNWATAGQHEIIAQTFSEHQGCFSYDTLIVQVDKRPSPQFNPNGNVCAGDDIKYTTTSVNPTWKVINGEVVSQSNQSFEVKWPSSPGAGSILLVENSTHGYCFSKDSMNINIYPVPAKPTIYIIKGSKIDTLISSQSPNSYYEWYIDDISVLGGYYNGLVTTLSGLYQVEVYNNYGCGTKSDYLQINIITETTPEDKSFVVYPNPAETKITMEWTDSILGEANLTIYSTVNSIVKDQTFQKSEQAFLQQLDISDLSPGLYILKMVIGGRTQVAKFIKL